MGLKAEDLELIRHTVQEVVESAQDRLAQMVAKQSVELQASMQEVQESIRKSGVRQIQMESDLADVSRTCEVLRRRIQDLHVESVELGSRPREVSTRLDHLEREVAQIRQRLSSVGQD